MTTSIAPKKRGRPPGRKNNKTLLKQEMEMRALEVLEGMALDALQALHKNALAGDTAAAKALVDKFLPNAQPGEGQNATPLVNINISPIRPGQTPVIDVTPVSS